MRRSHRSLTTVAALAALLPSLTTGCASDPQAENLRNALESVPTCCTGPGAFPFRPTVIEQRTVVAIDAQSPAYGFPRGKSFFAAFALPTAPQPIIATVASFPVLRKNGLNEWIGSYFAPAILFYDESFQAVGSFEGPTRFLFNGNGRRFSALHAPVPANARYLVVFTDPRLLSTTLPVPVEFSTLDTSTVACDLSGRAAGAPPADPITALCGLFAGLSIYTPPPSEISYATIPRAAGGNLELWLTGPDPKQP